MAEVYKTDIIIQDERDTAEMFTEMMRVNGFPVIKMFSSAPSIPILIFEDYFIA